MGVYKSICKRGHPLSGENLRVLASTGHRTCRACEAIHCKRYRQERIHPLYYTWKQMRQRCENPRHVKFKYWGGAVVKVCERWGNFATFIADMGPRPPGTSIDRIDPNGDYEPGNCRWATPMQQTHNRRPSVSAVSEREPGK